MAQKTERIWENWTSVVHLALIWKLSKRRVQQIIAKYESDNRLMSGSLTFYDNDRVYTVPIYKLRY